MKKLIFFIAACCSYSSYGQGVDLDNKLTIPPSPQAAEFIKYIDYPVDLSSGLTSVTIPLYTVKSGQLTVPLALSYHGSGLKPTDDTGSIGLGWTLNYGGTLSRTAKGQLDEKCVILPIRYDSEFDMQTNNMVSDPPDQTYYLKSAQQFTVLDTQPDFFSFSTLTSSGKFLFNRADGETNGFVPVTLPYKPVDIKPHVTYTGYANPTNRWFDYFDITTPDGTLYRFGKSVKTDAIVNEKAQAVYPEYSTYTAGISTWLLTEIISANGEDTVSYEYTDVIDPSTGGLQIERKATNHFVSLRVWRGGVVPGPTTEVYQQDGNGLTKTIYNYKKLSKIKFRNGEVIFTYKSDNYPDAMLEKIEVKVKGVASALQTIVLDQSQFAPGRPVNQLNWYKLNKVKFLDKNLVQVNQYGCEYKTGTLPAQAPPHPGVLPNLQPITGETYALDYWGYYNGKNGNPSLKAVNILYPTELDRYGPGVPGDADRSIDATAAQTCMLTKLTYPTGGSIEYEYEGNGSYGGIRIKAIKHKNVSGELVSSRSYEYPYDFAYGINSIISPYLKSWTGTSQQGGGDWSTETIKSKPEFDIFLNGRPVTYTLVRETITGDGENNGMIEHIYDRNGMETKGYDIDENYWPVGAPFLNVGMINLTNWSRGDWSKIGYRFLELFEKETKTFDVSGNLRKRELRYYRHDTLSIHNGMTVRAKEVNGWGDQNYEYDFRTYLIFQYAQTLDSSKVEYYGSENTTDIMTVRKKFEYNNKLLLSRTTSYESDGDLVTNDILYPQDFSGELYTAMKYKNMVSIPLRETTSLNGQPIHTTYNNYNMVSEKIRPVTIQLKKGSNPLETRFQFLSYNAAGLLTSARKSDNTPLSMIYGYKETYPVAFATNALLTDIAFTNFEDKCCNLSTGNWTLTANSWINDATSPLGTTCYQLTASNYLQKTGLTSTTTYIVSYWSKNGSYTVSGNQSVTTGNTENGWTFYEHRVSGITSLNVQGSGYIDLVRLHPLDADMKTFSWEPLVGMTSSTDVNNITTYFEFDAAGRLKNIRDLNKDIQSAFEYFYSFGN